MPCNQGAAIRGLQSALRDLRCGLALDLSVLESGDCWENGQGDRDRLRKHRAWGFSVIKRPEIAPCWSAGKPGWTWYCTWKVSGVWDLLPAARAAKPSTLAC